MKRRDFRHINKDAQNFSQQDVSMFHQSQIKEFPFKLELAEIERKTKNMEAMASREFLYLEMFLYFGEQIFNSIYNQENNGLYPFQDIHLITQNHPEYFRGHEINKKILKRAMFLLAPSYGRGSVNRLWKTYIDDIPPSLRMYDVVIDDQEIEWVINNKAANFDINKNKELFSNIINEDSVLQLIANNIPFATNDHRDLEARFKPKKFFEENNREQLKIKLKSVYPDFMFKDDHSFIMTEHIKDVIKSKKGLHEINCIIDIDKTALELANQSGDEKWTNVGANLCLEKINYEARHVFSTKFQLQTVTHILGRLGSGKSFITKILTKNLTNYGKRILILENDVAKSLKLMKELKDIGIKAAVFFGESDIDRHMDNFASSNIHAHSNLFTFYEENSDELATLANNNFTEAVISEHFPKFKMTKNQTLLIDGEFGKVIAPDYSYNDAYKRYEMLTNADVWIGNYEAFLLTKAPYYVDVFERNFLTLAWLRSDLIIADEYDQVQLRFDDNFVQTINLVTNTNNKNKNFLDYMYSLLPEIEKSKVKGFLEAYTNGISTSQKLGHYLYSSIFSNPRIRQDLKNKSFTKEKLFFEFAKIFIEEKYQEIKDFNGLKNFLNEAINTIQMKAANSKLESSLLKIRQYYTGQIFSEPLSSKEKLEFRNSLMVDLLDKLKSKFKLAYKGRAYSSGNYSKEIITQLDLLLSFAMFDYHNRYLLNEYQTFMMFWDQENKELLGPENPFVKPRKEVYVPAPLLGDMVSYRFSDKEDSNGRLELQYYMGVGRDLLARLPNTFEYIEGAEKPAVLFLSATSYNPGSSAYHTRVNPHWLLSNKAQSIQRIDLSYTPKKDEEDMFNPIRVSGLPTIQKKEKALRKLVKMLVDDGNFERDFQRMQEEYELLNKEGTMNEYVTGKRRIIAAPVFSFELAEILGKILEEETNYKVLVQFENNKYCKGVRIEFDSNKHVTKNDIENIHEREVDIIVFVANSVGRGLNILQGKKNLNSLIGIMYFFIRPYPQPDIFNELLHQLHGSFGTFLSHANHDVDRNEPLYKYWNKVQGKLNGLYTQLINRRSFWKALTDENKKVITLNMLTLIYQTMGRGLRGNTNLTVYLLDAAFARNTAEASNNSMKSAEPNEESYKDSMLAMMEHLLWNESDFLMDIVFEPLKMSLKGVALKPKEEVANVN